MDATSGLIGSHDNCVLNMFEEPLPLLRMAARLHSSVLCEPEMVFSASTQALVTFFVWFGCFSETNSPVGLLYISLTTAEFILMRLLFTSVSSLESCLFKPALHVLLCGFLMLAAMQTAMKLFSQSPILILSCSIRFSVYS